MRTTKLVIRQKKNTKPIRYDKTVECKGEYDLVECDNVISCVMILFEDSSEFINISVFARMNANTDYLRFKNADNKIIYSLSDQQCNYIGTYGIWKTHPAS